MVFNIVLSVFIVWIFFFQVLKTEKIIQINSVTFWIKKKNFVQFSFLQGFFFKGFIDIFLPIFFSKWLK